MENGYCGKNINEVIGELKTSEHGLEKGEVKNRLLKYGANKLPEAEADSLTVIFLRQFQSPLIFILLLATVVVFLTGENTDGFVILFVLFFNAIVGTIQEGKAQNIFASLKNFIKTNASVFRNGEEYIIPDEEVVPGDIIILREGEKVPADARIIFSESLQTDESALTGESNPKFKTSETIKKTDVPISDQKNMVFKGTSIVAGSGKAVVIATGINTVIGNIAKKIATIDEELPLKKDIRRLSRFIIVAVFAIAFVLLEIGVFYGHNLKEIFSTIVAVSVSVIPEGLPIVVTLVLATGVFRMGKRNVLVKRLQAVEALGQTDIIAVDKTGTITKNELVVKEAYVGGKLFSVKGIGYEPKGEFELDGKTIEPLNHSELLMLGKIGALCSSAHLAFDEFSKVWKISGDPTEAATLVFSEKMGFQKSDLEKEFAKIEERSFDYQLKYHAVLHEENNEHLLSIVGAPEEILDISEKLWTSSRAIAFSSEEKEKLKDIFARMSEKGLRVVALGMKKLKKEERIPEKLFDIEFVGFLGIEDSTRMEVGEAVNKVASANIKLVMITGDHKVTARAIAKEAGIWKRGDEIIEGKEIEQMTEEELAKRLEDVSVFARVTPFHKLKIINAYKLAGKTVAMTGDGVNDALSLTSADVGVSMGKIGTEVAKEASDIVLLDDNFGSIVSGVEEGRNIFKTIKRVILYLFSTSLGEVLTIIGAILLGFPLPILAAQILWLNLVTDGFLDVALAMEPKGNDLLKKRKFFQGKDSLVDWLMVFRMIVMALPMAIGTLYLFSQNYETDLRKAWTISLSTLAIFQWFNAWNCRSQTKSIFASDLFSNKFLIGATGIVIGLQLLAVYNPFFQKVLRTVPLSGKEWLIITSVAFSVILVEESRKLLRNKLFA